jgi:thioredoxin reductase (NADPH)
LFLSQFADRVRVVEFNPELKASQLLQEKIRRDPRFEIHANTQVTEFVKGENGKLAAVRGVDRASGEELEWHPAGAFVFVGLDPNTQFLRDEMQLDQWGFVRTDRTFETSMHGVFAAGDVRAGSTKQLGAAIGEGITALLMVRAHLEQMGDVPEHVPV